MNERNLSERLARVADYIPLHSRLADIGSDHAYLPAWLILNHKIEFAIAGEVVEGPYRSADKLVRELGLQDQIKVRLADGLEAIRKEDQISAVTICGMGGKLIRDILDSGKKNQCLTGNERLILQPNVGEPFVRKWLQENQYIITEETILSEDQKIYEIIVAEKSSRPQTYSEEALLFGPVLMQEKSAVFLQKWLREEAHRAAILSQLEKAQAPVQEQIFQLETEIKMIEELRK